MGFGAGRLWGFRRSCFQRVFRAYPRFSLSKEFSRHGPTGVDARWGRFNISLLRISIKTSQPGLLCASHSCPVASLGGTGPTCPGNPAGAAALAISSTAPATGSFADERASTWTGLVRRPYLPAARCGGDYHELRTIVDLRTRRLDARQRRRYFVVRLGCTRRDAPDLPRPAGWILSHS